MAADKDEEVKRPTLRMEHVKDFLQRNSSPNHKLSLNEIAMGL